MKIFIAFPFTAVIDKENGVVNKKTKSFLNKFRNMLIKQNFDVFLAHYREKWGLNLMLPDICTPLDLKEMKEADLVIAFPDVSGGVHIELGWASILNKPIILMLDDKLDYSPLVLGLNKITDTSIIYFDNYLDINIQNVLIRINSML